MTDQEWYTRLVKLIAYSAVVVVLSGFYWVAVWFGLWAFFYGDCCMKTEPPGVKLYFVAATALYILLLGGASFLAWRIFRIKED